MLRYSLVYESDRQLQQRLKKALVDVGFEQVSTVSTTSEFNETISIEYFDLILLPLWHSRQLLRPLLSALPGCQILLTTDRSDLALPPNLPPPILGLLNITNLDKELNHYLPKIESQDTRTTSPPLTHAADQPLSAELFVKLLKQADLDDAIHQIIFSRHQRIVQNGGFHSDFELSEQIVSSISDTWEGVGHKSQIWNEPGSSNSYLLFSRPVGSTVMTLVASPDMTLDNLAEASNRFLEELIKENRHNVPGVGTGSADRPEATNEQNQSGAPVLSVAAVDHTISVKRFESKDGDTPLVGQSGAGNLGPGLLGAFLYLIKHVGFSLMVLLVLIFVTYFGVNAARGLESGEAISVAVTDTTQYLGRLLQGDLGMTTAGSDSLVAIPVSQVIVERLPRSLALMGISLISATIFGIILGIFSARRGTKRSLGIILATIIGISVPSFFAAFLLQLAVITMTKQTGRSWLPVGGWGWDSHLILPVLVLAARPLAQITRVTFVSVRDVLDQDYIRTAYSKGLRRVQVVGRHVMRNAAIPILVTVGVSLSFILGSLPVVELYFGIPGVGFTLLGAIAKQDDELAVALLLCLGALFLLVQILLDIGNRLVDPRTSTTPDYQASGKDSGPLAALKSLAVDVGDYITDNAITRIYKTLTTSKEAEEPGSTIAKTKAQSERIEIATQAPTRRVGWASAYKNTPLIVGAILMITVLVVVLFGTYLAPHSPYATRGLEFEGGEFSVPPFEPGDLYPWGTDVLGRDLASLILTGAQLTLTLALLVVVARMGLGILLGALAGWRNGSWLDRLVMGLGEIIAAFPNVLLAMLIILALGIRQGMWPFIVGLGFVGWGDTMRFVRGEVTSIRPRAFIESAVAIGARTPRIIFKHIMPNLFSPLIALFALEMGAVLMLLGELGFLSIFVGGGAFYQLDTFAAPFHYSDVPEWGALLSNIRTYSRSYPWLAIYPTVAFFIAILAFNLFGEGIRRLVDDGSIIINRLFNRYTIGLTAALVVVFIWLRSNSGPVAFYKQHAEAYDGQLAAAHVAALTDPAMESRGLGTEGLDRAANYIAEQFDESGLQEAGEKLTYFQERFRSFGRLDAIPKLVINDGETQPSFGQDYAAYPGRYIPIGTMRGPIRYVGLGDRLPVRGFGTTGYRELRRADFSEEILLALSEREASELRSFPHGGMLIVVDDQELLQRHFTLPGRLPLSINPLTGITEEEEGLPSMWISEELANRLLAPAGTTVAELREEASLLDVGEVTQFAMDTSVEMIVEGSLEERWPVQNIIGHMPGLAATPGESQMDNQVILVLAQYDSPPPAPYHENYSAANDNASGVGVMLEAIRVMQETEYQPNRTFLFIAYSGEGLEGGERVSDPEISRFLQAKVGFATSLNPEAVIHIRGVGAGSGDALQISAGGSLRLVELFETAARRMNADVKRRDDPIDISVIYEEGSPYDSGQDAPEVSLSWEDWSDYARLPIDTIENISTEKLEDAGRTLTLALMIMGREREY